MVEVIAQCENGVGADVLFVTQPSYKMFIAGTSLWTSALLVDDKVKQITINVLREFMSRRLFER